MGNIRQILFTNAKLRTNSFSFGPFCWHKMYFMASITKLVAIVDDVDKDTMAYNEKSMSLEGWNMILNTCRVCKRPSVSTGGLAFSIKAWSSKLLKLKSKCCNL